MTRHKTFRECLRQYYLNYYGYWNGWSTDAPDDARLIYRLKKMQSLPMWLGDVVHRIVERVIMDLRNDEARPLEQYQNQARKMMNKEYMTSLEGKWRWKPKYNLNLFEHYYGAEITAEQRTEARDKVFRCLEHFMNSDIFERLAKLKPREWKSVEVLDKFLVGDYPVFVKIDCAVQTKDGLAIIDWKTGKETEDTTRQLGCYALYAYHQWHVPLENQRLLSFYLDNNARSTTTPTAEGLIDTKDFILTSAGEMAERLDGSVEENAAREENFPMTDKKYLCKRCFFRERCYQTRPGPRR